MRRFLLIKKLPGPDNAWFNSHFTIGHVFKELPRPENETSNNIAFFIRAPSVNELGDGIPFEIWHIETNYFKELS